MGGRHVVLSVCVCMRMWIYIIKLPAAQRAEHAIRDACARMHRNSASAGNPIRPKPHKSRSRQRMPARARIAKQWSTPHTHTHIQTQTMPTARVARTNAIMKARPRAHALGPEAMHCMRPAHVTASACYGKELPPLINNVMSAGVGWSADWLGRHASRQNVALIFRHRCFRFYSR